ncbi:TIR domain-containing protein [Deinococcus taklimakanensis]|uniref:TIR domain-containing protein n=1 Tax=Deinococcus taklimakanensis TaxID=536443 RepID=A0ABW5P4M9_9DEIO
MARNVFYSFHYAPDSWRASQVRNMGVITGNAPCRDHDWEEVTKGGDAAIKRWIASQMSGRTCAVVLVGTNTARRKWINYEIEQAWGSGKGVVAVRIHGLKNSAGLQSAKGGDPYQDFNINGTPLGSIAKTYDPPYASSTYVYDYIQANIADWVEEAIKIRNRY